MKNTWIHKILDLISPHHCYYCGKLSSSWCEDCRRSYFPRPKLKVLSGKSVISREIFLSERDGILMKIVDDYKFNNRQDNHEILLEMLRWSLESIIRDFERDFCLVPLPTNTNHIRTRGFDHISLIGKKLATSLNISFNNKILVRAKNTTQRGKTAKERRKQADKAYKINGELDSDKIYILFDDIKTTGSTLKSAARLLRAAGAEEIWAVYILRQK
ncbi:MAG: ComF family protein [Candidatus Sacchiramonaceae bacterium]|nr:ComF family protein [Candidatus Saccharimonadaceae bacterium]